MSAVPAARTLLSPPGQRRRPAHGLRGPHGLHGHPLDGNVARAAVAEAAGTFFLVLAIIGTAIAATLGKPVAAAPYGSLGPPLTAGLVLTALVAALGPVSGAHLNPAVTIALALNRHFPWRHVPAYAAAQLAGALAAGLAAWASYGERARSLAGLGGTYPARGVGAWQVFGTETVATMLLVLVIVAVATNPEAPAGVAAVAIGFTLAAVVLACGPLTGAGANPARSLGPMIVAGRLPDWWCYVLGPLAGACAAVALYERVLRPVTPPVPDPGRAAQEEAAHELAAQEEE